MRLSVIHFVKSALFASTIALNPLASAANFYLVNNDDQDSGDHFKGDGVCADAEGKCTLRAAIEEGNASGGQSYVFLESGATYELSSKLEITNKTIMLPAWSPTTKRQATIKPAPGKKIQLLEINAPYQTVSMANIKITGGYISNNEAAGRPPWGAGMHVGKNTTVYLYNSAIVGNTVDRRSGAGIFNEGTMYIDSCNISDNVILEASNKSVAAKYLGGGLLNYGQVEITKSSFMNNRARTGGAIASSRVGYAVDPKLASVKIIGSTFSGNRAAFAGAAIFSNYAELEIIGSTFINNDRMTEAESPFIYSKDAGPYNKDYHVDTYRIGVIESPTGDARWNDSYTPNPEVGETQYTNTCAKSTCHGSPAIPAKVRHYSEKALFAYVDSIMVENFVNKGSPCRTAECIRDVVSYLKGPDYIAPDEGQEVVYSEAPSTYVGTSIVVNKSPNVMEFKKGKSNPHSELTLWGSLENSDFPGEQKHLVFDLNYGGYHATEYPFYNGPAILTESEENQLVFELTDPKPSPNFTGIKVAKPISAESLWKDQVFMVPCTDYAEHKNLQWSYDSAFCEHVELAGNYVEGRGWVRFDSSFGTSGMGIYSYGAWEPAD